MSTNLSRILPIENIVLDLEASSKQQVFEQAGLIFENNGGLSGAIDTSALHLELQSLFNRIVGIIGSAASMDYGTPNDPEPQG